MTQGPSMPPDSMPVDVVPVDVAPADVVVIRRADTDTVHDPTSCWERRYCVALFVVAAVVGAVLVGGGAPLPPVAPVVLLAVLVALSVNLGALFTSEFSATADVAILFAAVVGFATDAPLLGAFAIGLLMGPLDWVHWKQRVFYRMAYNSGSQSLCVLLAAVVFGAVVPSIDDALVVLAAAAGAAVIWMVADIALVTLLLVRRGGTTTVAAARHVLVLDGIAVPFAIVGAVAGLLARDTGWWAAALVLAPMPFVPDLVLVRARRLPVRRLLAALRLPALVIALVGVGIVAGDFDSATLVALAVLSVIVGAEVRPVAGAVVAPVLATVVIAAAVVVHGRDAFLGAALVAVGGVSATFLLRRRVIWSACARALVLGVGAALASVGAYDAVAGDGSPSTRAVVAAVLAGIAFEAVVVVFGGRARGAELGRAVCSIPVLAVAAALATTWVVLGTEPGAPMFALLLLSGMTAVAWWGAPPWSSRWLSRIGEHARGRRIGFAATAVAAVGAGTAAVAIAGEGQGRIALVMFALAGAQGTVAMAAVAVRQWRFAPRRRAFDAVVLAVVVCALTVGYPLLGLAGSSWSVVLLATLLAQVVAVAWPLGALADRAARLTKRNRDDQRIPTGQED